MAARNKNTITLDSIAFAVATVLAASGKDATTVAEVAAHMETTPAVIMTVWNEEDPDDAVISGERGEMWLTESDDEETPAPIVPNPAQRLAARRVAQVDSTPETPVESASLVNEISNESKAEIMNENTDTATTWTNDGGDTHFTEYVAGQPVTGHTFLPVPEMIPAPPEGVNANIWELSQSGATLNARIFWGKRVREQMDAHAAAVKAAEEAVAQEVPETPAVEWAIPIDPITGQPYPF